MIWITLNLKDFDNNEFDNNDFDNIDLFGQQ